MRCADKFISINSLAFLSSYITKEIKREFLLLVKHLILEIDLLIRRLISQHD